jgi:hypothetical protein
VAALVLISATSTFLLPSSLKLLHLARLLLLSNTTNTAARLLGGAGGFFL